MLDVHHHYHHLKYCPIKHPGGKLIENTFCWKIYRRYLLVFALQKVIVLREHVENHDSVTFYGLIDSTDKENARRFFHVIYNDLPCGFSVLAFAFEFLFSVWPLQLLDFCLASDVLELSIFALTAYELT